MLTVEAYLQSFPELQPGRVFSKYPKGSVPVPTELFAVIVHEDENKNTAVYGHGGLMSKLVDVQIYLPPKPGAVDSRNNDTIWDFMVKLRDLDTHIDLDRSGAKVVEVDLLVHGSPREDTVTSTWIAVSRLRLMLERPA
jgi:hypothetical protein